MKYSAGIIPFRKNEDNVMEFFLGHPGGRMWECIDYWAFLKGGVEKNESWQSEMLIPLGTTLQNPKKTVIAYALHYPNIIPDNCHSNMADNGLNPEIDKYRWMTYKELESRTHETHLIFYKKIIELDEYYSKQGSDF